MNNPIYFSLFLLLTFGCAVKTPYKDSIPQYDNLSIDSKFVEETRIINVWLPPNSTNTADSLPVLYMLDGGIKEDFPHIANTLAKLIKNKEIPPIMLVGIENTERGRDLTGFSAVEADSVYCPLTDGAKNFRAFLKEELIPEINTKYRTTRKKGIIGESLAGLFIMETLFLEPNSFDFYIAMDPSLWWNNHHLESMSPEYLNEFPDQEIKLWFAGSDAKDISIHTNNLAKTLQSNKPDKLSWKYAYEPKEKHNTIFRATKEKALIWILNENE